jgi:cyclase
MQRERISENVYWFQSEIYAQVTSGVIAGSDWAVVIDTMAIPEESLQIRQFIEDELKIPVRYIINTHHQADHTWGNCYFPGATVIAHTLCRQLMQDVEQKALEAAQKQNAIYRNTKIVLPQMTFQNGSMSLRVGKKHLTLLVTPGNSPDGISILVEEDRILFAGDVFMPVPFIVEGDLDELINSIRMIGEMSLENIIQGHGDIILRGEIEDSVRENVNYLNALNKAVRTAMKRKNPLESLDQIDVESCGKSKVLLGGLAEDLHTRNVYALYKHLLAEPRSGEAD